MHLEKIKIKKNLLILIAISLITVLRFVHLSADTPRGIDHNIGLYVDEGYKTLSPRNLVLFGNEHWNKCDEYRGWMRESPLTQWAYCLAFLASGANIQSARSVTIISFSLFLTAFAYAFKDHYSPKLFYNGLLFLGLENVLFFYSRVALFEIPLILLIYGTLFIIKKMEATKGIVKFDLIVLILLFSYFLIKKTAFLYLIPVFMATTIILFAQKQIFTRLKSWQFYSFLSLLVVLFTLLSFKIWMPRIEISMNSVAKRILNYTLMETSPIVVISGMMCAFHGLIFQTKSYLYNPYRVSLLSIILICPLILAFFPYNPLRYYVPILPAYILICLEWLNLNPAGPNRLSKTALLFSFPFIILTVFYLSHWIGLTFFILIACLILLLSKYSKIIRDKAKIPITIMFVMFYIFNISDVGSFLLRPDYQSMEIRSDITKIVPRDSSIAGDWAPFFTLDTTIRSIYMAKDFNSPYNIKCLRPDFFLFSDFEDSIEHIKIIRTLDGVRVGEPRYNSEYLGFDVILFPLKYEDE